ncbi:MAG: ABC transporter permease [Roseburia sp.]|nr:ABC transporter permease [Roseburia sp.]
MKTIDKTLGITFWQLTRRHLLVFFRNKVRVFFTLMVPFIIFLIYIFFLRDLEMNTVTGILSSMDKDNGTNLLADKELGTLIGSLVDSWMLSGIIAISTITVSLQSNWMIVSDRETGVNRDFASSPVNRNILICSYFLFNIVVTLVICFIFMFVCFIYLACMGEFFLTFVDFLTIVATVLFSTTASVLLTVFICSFISRDSTMASINTIFSAAVGFLIGGYMPFATMPDWVQNVCMFFPGTYSCSLMRFSFMATPIDKLTNYVIGLESIPDAAKLISDLTTNFGYNLKFFGNLVAPAWQALAHAVFIIVLLVANILVGKRLITVTEGKNKKIKKKK